MWRSCMWFLVFGTRHSFKPPQAAEPHGKDNEHGKDNQAIEARDRVSGVSLDQEAADLIRFQQAYQASAQVMQVASRLFDAILQVR